MRHLLLTFALSMAAGFCGQAVARCEFKPTENGFLHADQRLPANAKGVLFRLEGPLASYSLRNRKVADFGLVLSVPPPLSAKDFSIHERAGGKKLTPVVTRLSLAPQLGLPQPRLFASKSSHLRKCAAENLYSLDGCEELETNVDQFIAKGNLYEVTEDLKKAYGTFRVSAAEGFVAGKDYLVRYSGPLKDSEGVRYRRAVHLSIDQESLSPHGSRTKLVTRTDVVSYQVPTAAPYLDSMHFVTMLSLDSCVGPYVPLGDVQRQRDLELTSHTCGDYSLLRPGLTRAEYRSAIIPRCHCAKGFVGFLEVDERFSESDVLRVNCR